MRGVGCVFYGIVTVLTCMRGWGHTVDRAAVGGGEGPAVPRAPWAALHLAAERSGIGCSDNNWFNSLCSEALSSYALK